jgi:hypothetical protein
MTAEVDRSEVRCGGVRWREGLLVAVGGSALDTNAFGEIRQMCTRKAALRNARKVRLFS